MLSNAPFLLTLFQPLSGMCTETIINNLWSRIAKMEIDCNLKKWTNVQLTAFCFNFSIKHEPEATGLSCLVLAIALNIFPPVQYE